MSLKDWRRESTETQYLYESWIRKDGNLSLTVFKKGTKKIPQVQLHRMSSVGWIIKGAKSFKTKSKALAYAKSYMRKH